MTAGSAQDTGRRPMAERLVADCPRNFVAPPLEAERLEALTAFVACRKAEGGAPTNF
jgi:trimethylamine--corrinoid protein Co-methyltransferase